MIYFLINNNYHLFDVNLLYTDLLDKDVSLIQIPHTLNVVKESEKFKNIFIYDYCYRGVKSLLKPWIFYKTHRKVRAEIFPQEEDTLFVYTEYEILNQYIIELFKRTRAKVYILEDGMATALVYNIIPQRLKIRHSMLFFYFKYVLGYKHTTFIYDGRVFFPIIHDKFIDGVCFYLNTNIKRKIKKYIIKNNTQHIDALEKNSAIFLNQDNYNTDQAFSTYLQDLKYILENIAPNFQKIYFKFHPREIQEDRDKIKGIVGLYSNIIIINNDKDIESIINEYKPLYAISYYSAALKSLLFYGIQPVFIYHVLTSLKHNPIFKELDSYLNALGYKFIRDFKDVNNSYESGLKIDNKNAISLRALL